MFLGKREKHTEKPALHTDSFKAHFDTHCAKSEGEKIEKLILLVPLNPKQPETPSNLWIPALSFYEKATCSETIRACSARVWSFHRLESWEEGRLVETHTGRGQEGHEGVNTPPGQGKYCYLKIHWMYSRSGVEGSFPAGSSHCPHPSDSLDLCLSGRKTGFKATFSI